MEAPEYRVVWEDTWERPARLRSSHIIHTRADAEEHRIYVDSFPHAQNVRVQERQWKEVTP